MADSMPIESPFPVQITEKLSIPEHPCEVPPTPPHHLKFTSVYTNRGEGLSIVDPKAKEKYHSQIKEIEFYEKEIARWTKWFLQSPPKEEGYCAIDWMENWAKQGALLKVPSNFQGGATRKWFLATIASHYSLLKAHIDIPKETKERIESWINALTQEVIIEYSKKTNNTSRHNNHIYWAAWAVMISSSVLDNHSYFDWALKRTKSGLRAIKNNGTLPRELARQARAFNYHVFSAAPLIMIAETTKQNGLNLYSYNNGALHRLVKLIVSELGNKQSLLTFLTRKRQDTKSVITPYSLAWLEVYHARFPSSKTQKWLDEFTLMKSRRIGGDMTSLFRAIPAQ
jgi:poly(beta-D-mannuronate) lyase